MKRYLDIVSKSRIDPDIVRYRRRAAQAELDRALEGRRSGDVALLVEEIAAYDKALEEPVKRPRKAIVEGLGTGTLTRVVLVLLACLVQPQAYAQDREPLPTGPVQAVLTAYDSGPCCCGDFPGKVRGQTASGKMAKAGRTLAAPRDVPFGTEIVIVDGGDGERGRLAKGAVLGIVDDRGGAIRWRRGDKTGQRILHLDVYFDSHKQAREWGVRTAVVRIVLPKTKKED